MYENKTPGTVADWPGLKGVYYLRNIPVMITKFQE
jgi:hypothetical protein